MAGRGIAHWQQALERGLPQTMSLQYTITGAKASSPIIQGLQSAVLITYDALSTQSQIDSWLGTTNEFLLAAFDATSMGTDAIAGIINMSGLSSSATGQAKQAVSMVCSLYSSTQLATLASAAAVGGTSLTSTSLTTQFAVGTSGNLAFRAVVSGLDALTSGLLVVNLSWVAV